jgi:hypothetical protein
MDMAAAGRETAPVGLRKMLRVPLSGLCEWKAVRLASCFLLRRPLSGTQVLASNNLDPSFRSSSIKLSTSTKHDYCDTA